MNAAHVVRQTPPAAQIARRAVDLSLDGRVSLDDGAHHLCHLANHTPEPLHAALQYLQFASGVGPGEECARMLLGHALSMLTTPRSMDVRASG
jgi:hypothetical protein